MTIKELVEELKIIDERLRADYDLQDEKLQLLARTTKISEEVGELANEVLAALDLQRPDKLDKMPKDNISKELMDVISTTLLLGILLNIDIETAIQERLEDIRQHPQL